MFSIVRLGGSQKRRFAALYRAVARGAAHRRYGAPVSGPRRISPWGSGT